MKGIINILIGIPLLITASALLLIIGHGENRN